MHKCLVLLLLFLQCHAWSQLEETKRIVKQLTSPDFHGRGYVMRGDSLAAQYLATEFKKYGLKPVRKSYFQEFHHPVNTFPGKLCVIVDGDTLVPGSDYLVDPSCPETSSARLRFKHVSSREAFNLETLKTILDEIRNGNEFNAILIDQRSCNDDTLKSLRGLGETLCTFIPTLIWTNEKFTWSVSNKQFNHPLLLISGKIDLKKTLFLDVSADFILDYKSYNVVGILPATRKTKRTIVVSAHYDHLGRMGSKTYFPGANDNASGTATMLAVAHTLSKMERDVNYLFIAFAGEEAGLVGSKYFTEHPLLKLRNIAFQLNLDIMGSGEEGITVVNATKHPEYFQRLQDLNSEQKLLPYIKARGPAANSDHYWFSEKGIPAFFIYTMGSNKNYHDIYDTYENLSFAETSDLVTLISLFLTQKF